MSRPPLAAGAVLVALLALVGAGQVTDGPAPRAVADVALVPVVGASAICPDLQQAPGETASRVSVGAAPPLDAAAGTTGVATAEPLGAAGTGAPEPLPFQVPGQVVQDVGAELDDDALVVQAQGALAAGLEVEQVVRSTAVAGRGLAGVRCEAPSTDAWFVGGATVVGQSTDLVLVNPDATAAIVDVAVGSATGPVDGRPGRGLVVPPRGRLVVALSSLAPDRDALSVHVTAARGRVASALLQRRVDGRLARGVDYVPRARPPATEVVVPGVPVGPGARSLLVANPGRDATTVSVEVTGSDGQFVPTGLEAVPVAAGTTATVDLTALAETGDLGVRVRSDGAPVLASVLAEDGQGDAVDLSWAGSADALSGAALITDLVLDQPTESTLLLSALAGDATVVVTPLALVGVDGPPAAPQTVAVPGGRTVALRLSTFLPPGTQGRLAVEVRTAPGSGPVHAARHLRERVGDGAFTTGLTLEGAAQQVPQPAVGTDPALGVG